MTDRDARLDEKLQALLDDRLGERRDAGLRSATLDPETRRALGAYKAVYRALGAEPPSALPPDFAARVARAAGYAPAAREHDPDAARDWAPWQVAVAAGVGALALCLASVAAIADQPARLLVAFDGPLGPLTVAAIAAVAIDQVLAARAHRGG